MIAESALRPSRPTIVSRTADREVGKTAIWPGPKDSGPDRASACKLYSYFVRLRGIVAPDHCNTPENSLGISFIER